MAIFKFMQTLILTEMVKECSFVKWDEYKKRPLEMNNFVQGGKNVLESFLTRYEISFTRIECTTNNNMSQTESCQVAFKYCNLMYNLFVTKDIKIFNPNTITLNIGNLTMSENEKTNYKWHSSYTGKVIGDVESFVFLQLFDDLYLNAFIRLKNITIIIEPLQKYSNYSTATLNNTKLYPHIFYNSNDIKKLDEVKIASVYGKSFSDVYNDTPKRTDQKAYRTKRSQSTPSSHACALHIVADHTFYQNIGEGTVHRTVTEVAYLVGVADLIFRGTDFNGDGFGDNIGVVIQNFTIFPTKASEGNPFKSEYQDAVDYLDQLSESDFGHVCLGYAFTFRDFLDGVVGVAYIGNSNQYGSVGGICQRPVAIRGKVLNSYNIGLVTMKNFGKRLDLYRSSLTFAHELGHSFGSSHDDNDETCSPNNEYGNYIMYPYSQDGSLANHNKFSMCSINLIYPVIKNKGYCFKQSLEPICGNGFREKDEECDCGSTSMCNMLQDICCVPADVVTSGDKPCKFRREAGKLCSPLTSTCCTNQCNLRNEGENYQCSRETECREPSVCDGLNATCSLGKPKSDGTVCGDNRRLCRGGSCILGICEGNELVACECPEISCKTCCRWKNSSLCRPLKEFHLGYPSSVIDAFTPGELCNARKGICDQFGNCIVPDYENTLKRLMSVFGSESMQNAKMWLKNYWYYLILAIFGIAILAVVAILTKSKMQTTHFQAFRVGRYLKVLQQIKQERELLNKKLDTTMAIIEKRVNDIKTGREQREYTDALARLKTFFPTAPGNVIVKTLTNTSHEELAVEVLIMKGYPLRKLLIKQTDISSAVERTSNDE